MSFFKNFKYLDQLIHSGEEEIILDSDITLSDMEESEYLNGINLDVDGLVIDGNGHEINAKGKTRILNCIGKNITIKNITLKEGYADTGGAILNNGKLKIMDSILAENTSEEDGGAILNDGGELTIIMGTFIENKTRNGGAIFNNEGELTLIKSRFIKNNATGNFIKKTESNYAYGGAIFNQKGNLKIILSLLKENISYATYYAYGGAIFNNEGELLIIESILGENIVKTDFEITDYNNIGYHAYGGAIYNNKSNLEIIVSTIVKNIVYGDGGGIYNSDSEGILTIIESKIIENKAREDGGGIFNNGELTILGSTFIGNTIEKYYEIILLDGGYIRPEPTFTTNPEKAYGAICNIYEKNVSIEYCTFEHNKPTFD